MHVRAHHRERVGRRERSCCLFERRAPSPLELEDRRPPSQHAPKMAQITRNRIDCPAIDRGHDAKACIARRAGIALCARGRPTLCVDAGNVLA